MNLTEKKLSVKPLPPGNVLSNWIGGRGLGVYYMLKEVDPKIDPFIPSNKIIIAMGPLTGVTGIPSSGR